MSVIDAQIGGDQVNNTYIYTLMSDGSVWYFGNGSTIVPKKVNNLEDIIQIDATHYTAYALKEDGTVWYLNGTSASKVSGFSNITKISTGYHQILALKDDGTVWGQGYNWDGIMGNTDNDYFDRPVQIDGVTGVVDVIISRYASIFILDHRGL